MKQLAKESVQLALKEKSGMIEERHLEKAFEVIPILFFNIIPFANKIKTENN